MLYRLGALRGSEGLGLCVVLMLPAVSDVCFMTSRFESHMYAGQAVCV